MSARAWLAGLLILGLTGGCGDPRPVVGVLLPLSGLSARRDALRGLEVLQAELGGRAPCRFVVRDHGGHAAAAISAVESLAAQGAVLILGAFHPLADRAAADACRDLGLMLLAPHGTVQPGVTAGLVACGPSPGVWLGMLARRGCRAAADGGSLATVADLDDPDSLYLAHDFEARCRAAVQRIERLYFRSGRPDSGDLVRQLLRLRPAAVFLHAGDDAAADLLRAVGDRLPDTLFLGTPAWEGPALFRIKPPVPRAWIVVRRDPAAPEYRAFDAACRRTGGAASLAAAELYDAATLAAEAIASAEDPASPADVGRSLMRLAPREGASGPIGPRPGGPGSDGTLLMRVEAEPDGVRLVPAD